MVNKTITPDQVRQARLKSNHTNKQMAETLGVNINRVMEWQRDPSKPSAKTIRPHTYYLYILLTEQAKITDVRSLVKQNN